MPPTRSGAAKRNPPAAVPLKESEGQAQSAAGGIHHFRNRSTPAPAQKKAPVANRERSPSGEIYWRRAAARPPTLRRRNKANRPRPAARNATSAARSATSRRPANSTRHPRPSRPRGRTQSPQAPACSGFRRQLASRAVGGPAAEARRKQRMTPGSPPHRGAAHAEERQASGFPRRQPQLLHRVAGWRLDPIQMERRRAP